MTQRRFRTGVEVCRALGGSGRFHGTPYARETAIRILSEYSRHVIFGDSVPAAYRDQARIRTRELLNPSDIIARLAVESPVSCRTFEFEEFAKVDETVRIIREFSNDAGDPYTEILEELFPADTVAGVIVRYAKEVVR